MRYEERQPDEKLKRFIKCFWFLERDYSRAEEGETLWPDGCQEIIFHFGSSYSASGQTLPKAFFIGTLSHYHPLTAEGPIRLFGVRLLPWGLQAFKEIDNRILKDKFVPLVELFPEAEIAQLEQKLAEAELDKGIDILTAFLHTKFQPDATQDAMIDILSKLYRTPMEQDIPASVAESGYSQRQFERISSELVGMSAKQLNTVSRFNLARLRIFFNPHVDLHTCMAEYGYYDYAHFSKDFKKCLGITPAVYKKWILRAFEQRKQSKNVVFLQDD
jgi:AraC-like DNA-binding protein